eukprot:Gb_09502 [translate_table: standard]
MRRSPVDAFHLTPKVQFLLLRTVPCPRDRVKLKNINGRDIFHINSISMHPWSILSGDMAYLQAPSKLHGTDISALHRSYHFYGASICHHVFHVFGDEE